MSAASPQAASAHHERGTPATGRVDPAGAVDPIGPINPRTGRPAGRFEGAILLACACMSVLTAVLMAPNLPRIQEAFATTPGVEILTPMVVTLPALMVGLTALVAGRIVDRVGRQRLLVVSLVL